MRSQRGIMTEKTLASSTQETERNRAQGAAALTVLY